MGKGTSTFGRDADLINFVSGQIRHVQKNFNLTNVEMAKVAGYDRSSFQRMLSGNSLCHVEALYRLSVHYNIPMDYWFPPRPEVAVYVPPKTIVREGTIPAMPPLTRKMILAISRLPITARRRLLVLVLRYHDQLSELESLAIALANVDAATRQKVVSVVETFITQMRRPAP